MLGPAPERARCKTSATPAQLATSFTRSPLNWIPIQRPARAKARASSRVVRRPGGHCEGQYTRSHPELGRENPQRRWYSVLRRGRVGHCQVFQEEQHTASDPDNVTYLTRGGAA